MRNHVCLIGIFLLFAVLLATGCMQQQQPATPATTTSPATVTPSDTMKIGATSLGNVLTDANGMTLYYFASDTPAAAATACGAGTCASNWPIFFAPTISVSAPLSASDFWSVTLPDGNQMTTYKGWPLYRFAKDTKPGDVNGEGIIQKWFVVKPGYTVMVGSTPQLGSFLTDASGKTLYIFTKDSTGTSACTGACLTKWPAFYSTPVVGPSILKGSDFTTISRADGVSQSAYMGWPLYYFSGDATAGVSTGQGFNNNWYVAGISGPAPAAASQAATTPVPTTIATTVQTLSPSGGGMGGGY